MGHTFFTSIHLHLLFLGLILIWLLRKNENLAFVTILATMTSVYSYLYIQLQGIETPVLLSWQLSVPQVIDYLSRVHFPTYTHIPPFFAGILIAYALETRLHLFKVSLNITKICPKFKLILYFKFPIETGPWHLFDDCLNTLRNCFLFASNS